MMTVGMPAGLSPPGLTSIKPKSRYSRRAGVPWGTDSSKVCTAIGLWGSSLPMANSSSRRPRPIPREAVATASQAISFYYFNQFNPPVTGAAVFGLITGMDPFREVSASLPSFVYSSPRASRSARSLFLYDALLFLMY
jgi:hypothetical protein